MSLDMAVPWQCHGSIHWYAMIHNMYTMCIYIYDDEHTVLLESAGHHVPLRFPCGQPDGGHSAREGAERRDEPPGRSKDRDDMIL